MSVAPALLDSLDGTPVAMRTSGFVRRLLRRKLAAVCVAYLAAVVGMAVVAPLVMPGVVGEHAGDLLIARQGPSWAHVLGTDTLGRDVLDRLLVGTRVTLIGVAEAVLVALILGVPVGLAAGFFGGLTDRIVGWAIDLAFSVPAIIIILVVLAVFPQSMLAAMVTLGVLLAPELARVVRSAVLAVRKELYIAAARVSGLSRSYIVTRHVLPRVSGAVIVQTSLIAAAALIAQTGLAFLGLVVAAPAPSWGGMVADGVSAIVLQPWLIWPPGAAIAITILAFGAVGDSVRDAMTEAWVSPSAVTRTRKSRATVGAAHVAASADALLSVRGLSVAFASEREGSVRVVDDIGFDIRRGEAVGLVGESGCGKTMSAMSILGLLPGTARIEEGAILFEGRNLVTLSERGLRRVRGREIALISQEPAMSLNPSFRIGWQLAEVVRRHTGLSRQVARSRVLELLQLVRLHDPGAVARRYPHELSGGMAQRVAIARALAGQPKLLIADEPTTALDTTTQAEILDLLQELLRERGMAILFVTHDWGAVAHLCDRAVVMYAGQIVEQAESVSMFREPLHPYTRALLDANPHNAPEAEYLSSIPGVVPQPGAWPVGCHFHPRCPYASASCRRPPIPVQRPVSGRETRCINYDQLVGAR